MMMLMLQDVNRLYSAKFNNLNFVALMEMIKDNDDECLKLRIGHKSSRKILVISLFEFMLSF